jgi:hypothetical protein
MLYKCHISVHIIRTLFYLAYSFVDNEELHNLYSSASIIRMIKSRRMRWAGHIAHVGEKKNAYRILMGRQKEKDHWEDQGIGGWTILKWNLREIGWNDMDWIDLA